MDDVMRNYIAFSYLDRLGALIDEVAHEHELVPTRVERTGLQQRMELVQTRMHVADDHDARGRRELRHLLVNSSRISISRSKK